MWNLTTVSKHTSLGGTRRAEHAVSPGGTDHCSVARGGGEQRCSRKLFVLFVCLFVFLPLPLLQSHGLSQGHCSSVQNSSSELSAKSMTRSCMLLNSRCCGKKRNMKEVHMQKGNEEYLHPPQSLTERSWTLQLKENVTGLRSCHSQNG